jgi:hypothetical protein
MIAYPEGAEDSARSFNPGKANTTAIRPVGALDLTGQTQKYMV